MQKKATAIISDLHLGGGAADPGDDHVYQGTPLVRFLDGLAESERGKKGEIELLINGDLFELAQVRPELYSGGDYKTWSSEDESLQRLNVVLDGHANIFETMKKFQNLGNAVTMAAGNHDVDLYWPKVQERIREVAGNVEFETGSDWYTRHDDRLHISHGHMVDPANKFDDWANPIVNTGTSRLEMCPGTLFMLKVVNVLEKDYPFVDNIKPITALAGILWRANKLKFASVAWLLTKFLAKYPKVSLAADTLSDPGKFYESLHDAVTIDDETKSLVREIAKETYGRPQSNDDIDRLLATEDALFNFMMDILRISGVDGLRKLEASASGTLSADGETGTLAIFQAGRMNEVEHLRNVAEERMLEYEKCEIVVMGHTHQPEDAIQIGKGLYYNTGSWTRYADIAQQKNLTLDKLKDESKFPYKLAYVWVEEVGDGSLKSEFKIFEAQPPKPF